MSLGGCNEGNSWGETSNQVVVPVLEERDKRMLRIDERPRENEARERPSEWELKV